MGDDDKPKDSVVTAGGAAQVKEILHCPYKNPEDASKPCPYKSRSEVVLQMHERAEHIKKDTVETIKDEESKEDSKKSIRIESKISKFTESETHAEFHRKKIEFESYKARCNIKKMK